MYYAVMECFAVKAPLGAFAACKDNNKNCLYFG